MHPSDVQVEDVVQRIGLVEQLLNMSSSHRRVTGPKSLSCSQIMSSSPTALLCFITLMPSMSSLVVKGLVKLESSCSSSTGLGSINLLGLCPRFPRVFTRS